MVEMGFLMLFHYFSSSVDTHTQNILIKDYIFSPTKINKYIYIYIYNVPHKKERNTGLEQHEGE